MSLTLDTSILELGKAGIARFGQAAARRLALAAAGLSGKRDAGEATVEDLLNYLPMRYEDRSNLARIADLREGTEASLELYVRVAGGFQVGKHRGPKQPPLFIFEITASDPERTAKPVVIWWFVSGRQVFPDLVGGEDEYRRQHQRECIADLQQRRLRRPPCFVARCKRVKPILENVKVTRGKRHGRIELRCRASSA